MKRIAYSLLLIALLSCGSHLSQSVNRIRLQIRDSTVEDFYLLSVRYNGVIVSPYTTGSVTDDTLIAHARLIPIEKIEAILYETPSGISALPGIGGGLIGTLAGCAVGGYAMKQEGDIGKLFAGGAAGGTLGFIGGMLIASSSNHPDEHFIYDVKNHSDELREHALYPDSEPDMLKLVH